jgi:hypothetical protein
MIDEQLDALKIAKDLRTPIKRLLRSLEDATSKEEVAQEAQIQIDFVHSLQASKRLRGPDVEALYILFDDAVQARLQTL